MAVYTEELATDIVLENMTAYRQLKDGVHYATRVYANEGYVIYDTADEPIYEEVTDPETGDLVYDPETGLPVTRPVIYYYTMVTVPANKFSVDTFTWVAVPRSEVDENYIFGGGDNGNHEVM